MASLYHLIYASTATRLFEDEEIKNLLTQARAHNSHHSITGMLLYADNSFFQVLEGDPDEIDKLYSRIQQDARHTHLTLIIREPIARRAFEDWSMGYASISAQELNQIDGLNDFFHEGTSFSQINPGRAKKLLEAFREGRWRSRLNASVVETLHLQSAASSEIHTTWPLFSYAYQPIVHVQKKKTVSYEALIRSTHNKRASVILDQVQTKDMHAFDEYCRTVAIELASRLGLECNLNLNCLPMSLSSSETAISSTIETAERFGINADRIYLELLESEVIQDVPRFISVVNDYRSSGVRIAIDDFGAGYAGLCLLADFPPDIIKLDMQLVRRIESNGPRQAIVRGIMRTCQDLGIEILAEGIESPSEYSWFRDEGIVLFQGNLFAEPGFEMLPLPIYP